MVNKNKEVLLLLTEYWSDWEASYAIAVINSFSNYTVKTISIEYEPKISMGGIKASIDYIISDYNNFNNLAMVIMPGGLSWEENNSIEIIQFIKKIIRHNVYISAICGATLFLGRHQFLNNINHTSDSLEALQFYKNYTGEQFYVSTQVVVDGGFITANETAAVEFAYEIFKVLNIDNDEEIEKWFDNFKNGMIR